ncbi:MAG: HWE histidine kinase domain-containing protein, partial [Pseudomonadota bacterium]
AQQSVSPAVLNHRVRNILNLIRNLITQSQVGAETVHDFTQIVGGRIHALAHAHDLITKRNWNAASLNDLIQIETRAYLGSKADRVHAHGVDAMIEPHAFTTIALVLHELITNSSKHGALCDSLGQVSIQSWAEPDGTLNLEWREKGGPKVKPPLLMSFGTTIIERSIPFELNGTADLQFLPEGVYARFSIPSSYLDIQHATPLGPARPETGSLTTRLDQGDQAARQRLLKRVLLVEDSMLIAMGTEQHLDKLGAERVFLTANNSDGIRYVEREHPTLCILDINLDGDVSTPVAEALVAANIPFVLATGYGSADGFLSKFPKVPLITKPYGMEELTEAIDQLITSIGQASNRHLPNDDVADHSGFIH